MKSNHHHIAIAINEVTKARSNDLDATMTLGHKILAMIGQPGIDSIRSAVGAVMKLQQGELAAEISSQLAESTLRIACQLAQEADFIAEVGAKSITAARAAITKRNAATKPPKQEKPKPTTVTPEAEQALALAEKAIAERDTFRARAEKAESSLFDIIAERDNLRTRVEQLQDMVASLTASAEPKTYSAITSSLPVEETVATVGADGLPLDIDDDDLDGWSAWFANNVEAIFPDGETFRVAKATSGPDVGFAVADHFDLAYSGVEPSPRAAVVAALGHDKLKLKAKATVADTEVEDEADTGNILDTLDDDTAVAEAEAQAEAKLPRNIKADDARGWNKWLATYTEDPRVKVAKKGKGFVVTFDGERLNLEPQPTAKAAISEAIAFDWITAADNVYAHTLRLRELSFDENATVEKEGSAYRLKFSGRSVVCASAVITLIGFDATGTI